MFINTNVRFCYQSKEKVLRLLEECEYEHDKIKTENFIDDNLEKNESDESDSDYNG